LGLLDVRILEGRAEELVDRERDLAGSFDAVVSRAVGGEDFMGTVGERYVRSGGTLAMAGSPRSSPEKGFELVRVQMPRSGAARIFLKRTKESIVPRGT
jgi:16S rRNA G527 N7-methylase RsmG